MSASVGSVPCTLISSPSDSPSPSVSATVGSVSPGSTIPLLFASSSSSGTPSPSVSGIAATA